MAINDLARWQPDSEKLRSEFHEAPLAEHLNAQQATKNL
jgi:hypothetical protein